ncbi:hypothetical protein [Candidatus Mycoplasma haematohominis]|uniref:hypothetical protein n=1 Tax=Candidatus Mycoplasma haematohominis TaxID=1494318 RepID=UPI001C0A6D23|nr:hypothetical protein [Candidatus Mycoplasma haemohominis]
MTPQTAAGIAAATVAVGGTSVGAYMLAKNGNTTITLKQFLSDAKTTNKTEYTEGNKLASVVKNQEKLVANVSANESWWNSRFDKYKQPKTEDTSVYTLSSSSESTVFQAVEKGYSSENGDANKALNQVCDAAYKKVKTEFQGTDGNDDNKKKYTNDVKKFCTLQENADLTIS